MANIVILITICAFCIQQSACLCTWPSVFQNSVWLDSDRGILTFNDSYMTGWTISYFSDELNEWECYHSNDSSSTTYNLIMRSTGSYTIFTAIYTPFACLQLTKITDYSYSYYQQSDEEQLLNYDRIRFIDNYAFRVFQNDLPTETELCTPLTSGPQTNEYHLLIKNDQTNNVAQDCSPDFYGNYSYAMTDSGGTTSCGTGNELWNVCSDRQQMTFDYSACNTEVAYSSSGAVSCVYSLTSGSYVLQTVMNLDVFLGTNNLRFTCFMSTLNADSSLTVSQAPGSCTKTQVPGSIPQLANGTSVGYNMTLTPTGLCPITTTSTTTTSTTTTSTTTSTTSTTSTTTSTSTTSTTTTSTTTSTTTTTPTTTSTSTTTTTPTTTSTTTTTPTTTSTTSTSTSTTSTTTTPSTTTSTTTTTTTEKPNNTLSYVAIGLVAAIFVLLIVVLAVFLLRRFCCKKKEKPPPPPTPMKTPDLIIEAMPHHTAGAPDMPFTYRNGPTGFMTGEITRRDVVLFPETKSPNFMLSIPQSTTENMGSANNSHFKLNNSFSHNTSTNSALPHTSGVACFTRTESSMVFGQTRLASNNTSDKPINDTHTDTNTSLMDTIIMDEKVNFALLYHPRMIQAKEEWDREHGKRPDNIVSQTAVPLALTQNATDSINQSFTTVDPSVSSLSPIHPDQNQSIINQDVRRISRISDTDEDAIEVDDSPDRHKQTNTNTNNAPKSSSRDRNTVVTSISSPEFKTSSPVGQVHEVHVSPFDVTSGDLTIPVSPHESTIDTITFTGDFGRKVAPTE